MNNVQKIDLEVAKLFHLPASEALFSLNNNNKKKEPRAFAPTKVGLQTQISVCNLHASFHRLHPLHFTTVEYVMGKERCKIELNLECTLSCGILILL